MEIRPNSHQPIPRAGKAGSVRKAGKKGSSAPAGEKAEVSGFGFIDELLDHLQQMPETREDFMEKGKNLFKQVDYPNEKHLGELERSLKSEPGDLKD